ncbi:MAG TPA: TonB family protein [Aliidongia sp.]|uniref:TonB family protein n=1 Tax=Aliidongia sp. TaxID=1914230 RepID=UPI002DDD6D0E|nr:TonB family protein [Aliidongia sp.]HEV2673199.1 TonB family protein [Aliidongia sp.]
MIRFRIFSVAVFVLLMAGNAGAETVPAAPIERPLPEYPTAANGTEGSVKLHFRIDANGRATDVAVVEASPPGIFENSAVASVGQWRYRARQEDGKAVEQPDNVILLKFKPEPADLVPALLRKWHPYYPSQAFDDKLEGDVTLRFDTDTLGMAENGVVLESTLPHVFDAAALKSLENLKFQPVMIDGKPQPTTGLKLTIPFRLADAYLEPIRIGSGGPAYPPKALNSATQGYCLVHFKITEDGSTENPEIWDTAPRDMFAYTCLAFARSVRYQPPGQEPRGHIDREHSMMIRFLLDQSGSRRPDDMRPEDWVRIQYTVTADGHIKDAKVIATSRPAVPTDEALRQIRSRHVKPFVENGVAVEKPNQIVVVRGAKDG